MMARRRNSFLGKTAPLMMAAIAMLAVLAAALAPALAPAPAHAITPEERLNDPKLEERARNLSLELRCLVCQNQSIDDSDAPFAQDLRRLIRRDIAAGKSDADIKDFLRQRYGDYVLLSPPLTGSTYMLWITPFAVLALGVGMVAWQRRNRNPDPIADANTASNTTSGQSSADEDHNSHGGAS